MKPTIVRTTSLLAASNIFMTFAWYAHLKNLNDQKWYVAAVASWGDRSSRISVAGSGKYDPGLYGCNGWTIGTTGTVAVLL